MLLAGMFCAATLSTASALPLPCGLGLCIVESFLSSISETGSSLGVHSSTTRLGQAARNTLHKGSLPLLYARSVIRRQEIAQDVPNGPPLGTILGGVFGAVGGLAIISAIVYAWWSIKRVQRNRAAHRMGASSSFGQGTHSQLPEQQSSKNSRGSSSNKSQQSKKPSGAKWKDPWLTPPPQSSRTVRSVAVKLDRPSGSFTASKPDGSHAFSCNEVPLQIIHSHVDNEHKTMPDGL